MAARYELRRAAGSEYYFNLRAANEEIVLTSERYSTKSGAQSGIDSVRVNSPIDARYDRRSSTNGQHYFVLRGANHEVIGQSEMYTSTAARETGIQSVKTNGPTAPVSDLT